MTEAYNDALKEQAESNIWRTMREEAANMSGLQRTQLVADVAGIFDPTPASDIVGGVTSALQGDVVGVGFSLLGMIPYVGDLGKIGKIAKIAPRTAAALEIVLRRSDELATAGRDVLRRVMRLDEVAAARSAAARRVREAMLKARQKDPNCEDCRKLVGPKGERRTLQMPKSGRNGRWTTPDGSQPADGNGTFEFTRPKTLPDGTTVPSIQYRDGWPDFRPHVEGNRYNIWEVSGDAGTDAGRVEELMRKVDPNWQPPDSDNFVLHHFEDGTLGYVPRVIHDKATGGVSHTGGNSIVNNKLF